MVWLQLKAKSDFLGMNFSTASARLRKEILFTLAKKLALTECFKCKTEIATSKEFSIEHKEPWYKVSVEKFWDLENIAFSHLKCNRPHGYRKPILYDFDGVKPCSLCKEILPVVLFGKKSGDDKVVKWNSWCDNCRKATGWGQKKAA